MMENSASLSPADSHDGLQMQLAEHDNLGTNNEVWNTGLRYGQQPSNYGPRGDNTESGDHGGSPGSLPREFLSDSTCINQIVREATDLEQNLLLEAAEEDHY